MAKPCTPPPVKLIASLLTGEEWLFTDSLLRLQERFGEIDFLSERMKFDYTDYYSMEFGADLWRRIVSFNKHVDPGILADVKLFTNKLESYFSKDDSGRKINIDPGYISLEKVVLASCKNFSHRIYLRDGIYAEVTLLYKKGEGFKPLIWTYPDYRDEPMLSIMEEIRGRHKEEIHSDNMMP